MSKSTASPSCLLIKDTVYRAAFVLPVTAPPIRDGFVVVREGRVTSVGSVASLPAEPAGSEIDLGRTILMPGFVNAHTHLELSHLEGAVPGDQGFVPWIEAQLRVRAERPAEDAAAGLRKSVAALVASGTAAVADVSNSLAAVEALHGSALHAVIFHEILGFDPARAEAVFEQTRAQREAASAALALDPRGRAVLHGSGEHSGGGDITLAAPDGPPRVRIDQAAHAPHSISRELFALLMAAGGVRSIHVAESRSEDEFLRNGGGEWRAFLDGRVGPIPFEAPGMSPVRYLDELGALTPGLLAVHCVRVDEDDAKLLAARGAVAVLCPRSNAYLGNGVPPLAMLLGNGVPIALGSDSLASCASLDVLEDARLLARRFPRIPKAILLHALTRGGAQALGFGHLGEIREGALARFAAIPFEGELRGDPVAFLMSEAIPARTLS